MQNNAHAAQLFKLIPPLDESNWYSWDQKVCSYFASFGQAKFLTEQPTPLPERPTADGSAEKVHADFMQESQKVLTTITFLLAPTWATPLRQQAFTTAYDAYKFLKTECTAVLEHDRARFRRVLTTLRMLPTEDAATYVDRARDAYDNLMLMEDAIYNTDSRSMVIECILDGLPDSWHTTITLIKHNIATTPSDTPRSILALRSELMRVETEGKARAARTTPTAPVPQLDAATATAFAAFLAQQRAPSHAQRSKCDHCHIPGHTAEQCFSKYADDHGITKTQARNILQGRAGDAAPRPVRDPRRQHRANLALTAAEISTLRTLLNPEQGPSSATVNESEQWCIDSGASAHMSPSSTDLSNYQIFSTPMKVAFAGNTVGDIVGFGTKHIRTTEGGFTLQRVLHVPDLVGNLLSLADCWRQRIGVHFDPENDIVSFVKDGTLVMTASFHNGLFYLNHEHHARAAKAIGASPPVDAFHWHRALGHVSFTMLARMKRANLLPRKCKVTAAEFLRAGLITCEPCVLAKNTRDSRPTSRTLVPRVCYILHADLVIMPVPDLLGNTCTLCVIDGHSSMAVGMPIKLKSDAKHLIPDIVAMYERQSGHTVLHFRTDRGGGVPERTSGRVFPLPGHRT